ncbi:uncharacterized protein LOC133785049 [Humulus lupulus]|uniref:uncharacterized protein LOC133785049 n=1 Tax=Humulus lupulus TaxID=3486 RepID=UPI002B411705|nr:uncharacterized protein LOC133785049 [Humulus lupulus]
MQSSSLENMLKEYIVKNETIIKSQAASLRNLENQVGGKELEHPKTNSGHKGEPSSFKINEEIQKDAEIPSVQKSTSAQNVGGMPQHKHPDSSISKQPPPFPQRFQKQKLDSQFKKFLDMLKQLHINIPLVEELEQMPNYVKFMKDVLTRKRSINLMSMSVFMQLGIGQVRPTTVTLQLAYRSLAHPDGKIEDVFVRVDKIIFPTDFIVLDYEADREVPIILGRSFLATGRTLIDVQKGELIMRVQDEKVTFNVFKAMIFPVEVEECSMVSVVDSLASNEFETSNVDDPLERLLLFNSHNDEDEEEYLAWLEANSQGLRTRGRFDSLELSSREFKAPKPLKVLPSHW